MVSFKQKIFLDEDQTISVLEQDEGYTVKYNPLPEGVPEGKARKKERKKERKIYSTQ